MTTATATLTPDTARVGDGAHYGFNGDAYPFTIIGVSASGKTITLQRDNYKVEAGQMYQEGSLKAEFSADPNGQVIKARWSAKRGRFMWNGSTGWPVNAGRRYAQNPHF